MCAKYRAIQTSFWNDTWVLDLTPERKLFFLYLLSNSNVRQCGIYEISLKQIELETTFDKDSILKLLELFEEKGKIKFSHNTSEICIINFSKYNFNPSPKVKICVIRELMEVKDKSLIGYLYGIDTIYKGYVYPMHTLSQEKQKEKEKEKQKENGDDELENGILSFFGFSELFHQEKAEEVKVFLDFLFAENEIENFRRQFEFYKKYKESTKDKVHGFKAFIGNPIKNYNDGGWCAENWEFKYNKWLETGSDKNGNSNKIDNLNAGKQDHAAVKL
jgi:hypothetical protein